MVVAWNNLMVEWEGGGGNDSTSNFNLPRSPPPRLPPPQVKKHEELTLRHGMQ